MSGPSPTRIRRQKSEVVTLGAVNPLQLKQLKFYLKLLYYNPLKPEADRWCPLPAGLKVKIYDYDPISKNDLLGEAQTTGNNNPIFVQVDDKDEDKPDIFFQVETGKKYIRLDTEALVDSITNPSTTFSFIALPEIIDSRKKKDTAGGSGYLDDFTDPVGKGTNALPWTFKLEEIQLFVQLKYYKPASDSFEPVPKGMVVSAYDYDYISPNDLQAVGCVGDNGKVYLPIFMKDENKPDIFFSIKWDSTKYLDRQANSYVDSGDPAKREQFVKLPGEWISKDNKDSTGSDGWKDDFSGSTIGTWDSPWIFHYIPKVLFSSPGIDKLKRLTHGAAVAVNNDWECGQVYSSSPPAGKRELEPIFDLDYENNTAGEQDLLQVAVNMSPANLPGTLELKAISGAARIRLWPRNKKGSSGDIISLPEQVPKSTFPKNYFIEGLQNHGKVELEVLYKHNGMEVGDTMAVNVVELEEKQGGTRKVIYEYNSNIQFEVKGAPANYSFKWDFNGDGSFDASVFESGKHSATETCKYGPAANAGTVLLPQTAANNRKIYNAAVEMTGGLVLHIKGKSIFGGTQDGIRLALGTNQGTALPAQSTAGLHTLFNWNDSTPVTFDATNAAHSGVNRITYNAGLVGAVAATHYNGMGANRKVLYVEVSPFTWTSGKHREELIGTINHEILHLRQHAAVRDNPPGNRLWRLLDDHYGSPGAYRPFREVEAYFSKVLDVNISWRHQIPVQQNNLTYFRDYYNDCLALLAALPSGSVKNAAKPFLQDIYRKIPFFEMKRAGYDFDVRAPN
ncbi:MAG: hypothetical protein GY754_08095 [bacterium]|nr:hypothetical protein [bacterium]